MNNSYKNEIFVPSGNILSSLNIDAEPGIGQLTEVRIGDDIRKKYNIPHSTQVARCLYCGRVNFYHNVITLPSHSAINNGYSRKKNQSQSVKYKCDGCNNIFSTKNFEYMYVSNGEEARYMKVTEGVPYTPARGRLVSVSVDKVYTDKNELKLIKVKYIVRYERFTFNLPLDSNGDPQVKKKIWSDYCTLTFDLPHRTIYYSYDNKESHNNGKVKSITPVCLFSTDAFAPLDWKGLLFTDNIYFDVTGITTESVFHKVYSDYVIPEILNYYGISFRRLNWRGNDFFCNAFIVDNLMKFPQVTINFIDDYYGQGVSNNALLDNFKYEMTGVYWAAKYDTVLRDLFRITSVSEYHKAVSQLLDSTFGFDAEISALCLNHPLAVCYVRYLWMFGWRNIENIRYVLSMLIGTDSLGVHRKGFLNGMRKNHCLARYILYRRTRARKNFFKNCLLYQDEETLTKRICENEDNAIFILKQYEEMYNEGFNFNVNCSYINIDCYFYDLSFSDMVTAMDTRCNPFYDPAYDDIEDDAVIDNELPFS